MASTSRDNNKQSAIRNFKLKILSGLELADEARNEDKKPPYPAGRFKRFFDVYRANNSHLMTANLMALIFMLPLFAVILAVSFMGAETLGYMLSGIKETPYIMGSFGLGLSSSAAMSDVKVSMLMTYRVLFLAIGVCIPIMSFGIAGHAYICTKLIWGESFVCKKDKKTGVDVPRIITEFFRGVKRYWAEMLIAFLGYGIFFAGGTNLIIEFISGVCSGKAGGGQWVALFAGIIILVLSTVVFLNLVPQVVSYHKTLTFAQKLKNACVYSTAFFIPSILILILICAPFALLAINTMFIRLIVAIALITLGTSYVVLAAVNYGDYNSEQVAQVLLENSRVNQSRENRKPKKKGESKAQGPVKYKKKK